MNFRPGGGAADEPRIELTSLVDVIFLLLIFFLLTTTFVQQPTIDVNLPGAASAETRVSDHELLVVLTGDGQVAVDGEVITLTALTARLRSARAQDAETTVLLQADEGVPHGQVVQVMDAARRVGLTRVAIATRKESP